MVIVITLNNNKSVLLDVNNYEFDGEAIKYTDNAGKHYIPFSKVKHWSFGTEQRKKEYVYNEVHGIQVEE